MADPNQLHTSNPKPEDPLQFIRKRLPLDPIDAEEFRCMKQSLGKLNEDMGQMKADVTKIANIVSQLLPNHATADVDQSANVSVPSMENNVGDSSHISMLDDSSLILDETVTKIDDSLNATMHTIDEPQLNCSNADAVNSPHSKDAVNDSTQGFTLEFVEVDVVNKSSFDLSTVSQDETVLEAMTSTPETTTIMGPLTDANAPESKINIDELPIVFKEEDSEEQLDSSEDFHGFDVQDVQESELHLSVGKIDQLNGVETLKEEPVVETVTETFEANVEPKTEQVKSQEPKAAESIVADVSQAESTEASTELKVPAETDAPSDLKPPSKFEAHNEADALNENGVHTESAATVATELATHPIDEIVEGILNKVEGRVTAVGESENVADAVMAAVDGPTIETSEVNESVAEMDDGCAVVGVGISMPKDDPETQLFLSYS